MNGVDAFVIRHGDLRSYYCNHEHNWLAALSKLEGAEVLTIHPTGPLTPKDALAAIVATYGVGEFELVKHGTAFHISRHFNRRQPTADKLES